MSELPGVPSHCFPMKENRAARILIVNVKSHRHIKDFTPSDLSQNKRQRLTGRGAVQLYRGGGPEPLCVDTSPGAEEASHTPRGAGSSAGLHARPTQHTRGPEPSCCLPTPARAHSTGRAREPWSCRRPGHGGGHGAVRRQRTAASRSPVSGRARGTSRSSSTGPSRHWRPRYLNGAPARSREGTWSSRPRRGASSPRPGAPATGLPRGLKPSGPSRPANPGPDPPRPGNLAVRPGPGLPGAAPPRRPALPRDGADAGRIRARSAASPWRRRRAQERRGLRLRRAAASGLPKAPPAARVAAALPARGVGAPAVLPDGSGHRRGVSRAPGPETPPGARSLLPCRPRSCHRSPPPFPH